AREYVEAGGLMSYGPNLAERFRRAADYVDKKIRGTKPGHIPGEQPTKFDLLADENKMFTGSADISYSPPLAGAMLFITREAAIEDPASCLLAMLLSHGSDAGRSSAAALANN